jgi:hypothetical protein
MVDARDTLMTLYTIRTFVYTATIGGSDLIRPTSARYSATKGFFYSHMGWIFYKPNYERMELVDREDLDSDPSECFDFIWQEVVLPSFSCPFPA